MKREIGSHFWINEEDICRQVGNLNMPDYFGCNGSDYVWLSTGRSTISFVIKTIEQRNHNVIKRVCLPAFTCHTVLEPFLKRGYEVITIPVGKDLKINRDTLEEYVKKFQPGIILLHSYFGFDTLTSVRESISNIQSEGIIIIEDLTQGMYSSFPRLTADYWMGSIRKWSGMPDGAFAVCATGQFFNKPEKYDKDLEFAVIEASILKRKYIEERLGEKTAFLQRYRRAESIISNQSEIYAICPTSLKIQSNLDWKELSRKRRINYSVLLDKLKNTNNIKPVFYDFGKNVVPLYLPIYCDYRDEVQKNLISHDIYAPIVWPKAQKLPEVDTITDEIYSQILCLPIDQRYDEEDMEYIVKVINREL